MLRIRESLSATAQADPAKTTTEMGASCEAWILESEHFTMASNRPRRNIQGPHSALTDFLAAHNISAAEIRQSYQQRIAEAGQQEEDFIPQDDEEDAVAEEVEDGDSEEVVTTSRKRTHRNAATEKAKKKQKANIDNGDDEFGEMMYQKKKSLPGQLANCEICSKRFTVTPYSKTGPNGGLLCVQCSKKQTAEDKKAKAKARKPTKRTRRQNFSKLLDGIAQRGAFSLLELCIKKVADNIHDIEEFGDLPPVLLHRLSQILSKRRALTPRTLDLFLRRDVKCIEIFDCAKLETEHFQKIFTFMPALEKVNLRFAGQLKDPVIEYIMERECHIKELQLDSANLISDGCWQKFFETCGSRLESLKLSNLDCSMGDQMVRHMVQHCPNLRRLKIRDCWRPSNDSVLAISMLTHLEHLSLNLMQEVSMEALQTLVFNVGPKLKTLSLQGFKLADDLLLDTIHQRCSRLSKFRFSDNAVCLDRAYAALFTGWQNAGLRVVDVSRARHLDSLTPDGPETAIGLASAGFQALMQHSGDRVERLDISSCRHVSFAAFSAVFDGSRTYPRLREIDVSFHTIVDDFLVNSMVRCCPALAKVTAFACFNIRTPQVPAGVALIGGVNANSLLETV
ncbi:UV-damaged DNA-binding protein rad7 [Ophidiomyces ophidiicola]|nr:UV-damaged DNA-binding protein rad7 [Ophidiomyces ophidiicola]